MAEQATAKRVDTEGRITDEGVAKIRARIGKGFEGRRQWRTEATRDAIYHLALAIGDLSPVYLDENDRRLSLRNDTWIRIERDKTREEKKYGKVELRKWTPADIARFQEEYRNQRRTVERPWKDVKVGDTLGPLLKGPLTPT